MFKSRVYSMMLASVGLLLSGGVTNVSADNDQFCLTTFVGTLYDANLTPICKMFHSKECDEPYTQIAVLTDPEEMASGNCPNGMECVDVCYIGSGGSASSQTPNGAPGGVATGLHYPDAVYCPLKFIPANDGIDAHVTPGIRFRTNAFRRRILAQTVRVTYQLPEEDCLHGLTFAIEMNVSDVCKVEDVPVAETNPIVLKSEVMSATKNHTLLRVFRKKGDITLVATPR